jgi:excisionase family DNA binding protein
MSPIELGITKAAYPRREAAATLSIGLTLLDEMIADGRLKSVKIGKKRLVLGASMAQCLSSGSGAQPAEARA